MLSFFSLTLIIGLGWILFSIILTWMATPAGLSVEELRTLGVALHGRPLHGSWSKRIELQHGTLTGTLNLRVVRRSDSSAIAARLTFPWTTRPIRMHYFMGNTRPAWSTNIASRKLVAIPATARLLLPNAIWFADPEIVGLLQQSHSLAALLGSLPCSIDRANPIADAIENLSIEVYGDRFCAQWIVSHRDMAILEAMARWSMRVYDHLHIAMEEDVTFLPKSRSHSQRSERSGSTTTSIQGSRCEGSSVETTIAGEAENQSVGKCAVCGQAIWNIESLTSGTEQSELVGVACSRCGAEHHRDCWHYNGRCGIYACGETHHVRITSR